eukprot:scaffold22942_cov64-Phaeocystis_antarctica.AAC.8
MAQVEHAVRLEQSALPSGGVQRAGARAVHKQRAGRQRQRWLPVAKRERRRAVAQVDPSHAATSHHVMHAAQALELVEVDRWEAEARGGGGGRRRCRLRVAIATQQCLRIQLGRAAQRGARRAVEHPAISCNDPGDALRRHAQSLQLQHGVHRRLARAKHHNPRRFCRRHRAHAELIGRDQRHARVDRDVERALAGHAALAPRAVDQFVAHDDAVRAAAVQ